MLNLADVIDRLNKACAKAGGVTQWCKSRGLIRSNVANMKNGRLWPSTDVCQELGLRRVILEIYLEPEETVPYDLIKFMTTRQKMPNGNAERKLRDEPA